MADSFLDQSLRRVRWNDAQAPWLLWDRPVEINRNQYFLVGIIVLLLGIQFRQVDTYVLNEKVSRALAKQAGDSNVGARTVAILPSLGPASPRKSIRPPEWLGWAIGSLGAVLILHSLAMPKPAG